MKTILKFAMAAIVGAAFAGGAQAGDYPKELKKCKSCHTYDKDKADKHKIGPNLYGVYGRKMGGVASFKKYSAALKKAAEDENNVWNEETLDAFLKDPKKFVKDKGFGSKSKMTKKFKKDKDRQTAISFLKAQAEAK